MYKTEGVCDVNYNFYSSLNAASVGGRSLAFLCEDTSSSVCWT